MPFVDLPTAMGLRQPGPPLRYLGLAPLKNEGGSYRPLYPEDDGENQA
jgi:hypothetical protein